MYLKIVNEFVINELVMLTMFWKTGPWMLMEYQKKKNKKKKTHVMLSMQQR